MALTPQQIADMDRVTSGVPKTASEKSLGEKVQNFAQGATNVAEKVPGYIPGGQYLSDIFGTLMATPVAGAASIRSAMGDPQGAAQIASQRIPFFTPQLQKETSTTGGAFGRAGKATADALSYLTIPYGESQIAGMTAPKLLQRAAVRAPLGAAEGVLERVSKGETDPGKLAGAGAITAGLNVIAPEILSAIFKTPQGKPAERISKVSDYPKGEVGIKGRMARSAVQPDVPGSNVGTISKEAGIAQDTVDMTKSKTKFGMAQELEKMYDTVNNKLDNVIQSNSKQIGKMHLVGPNGEPDLLDEIISPLDDNSVSQSNPEIVNKAKGYVEKLLTTGRDTVDTPNGEKMVNSTTLEDMKKASNKIGELLKKWYTRGAPLATENDMFNSVLADAQQNILESIAVADPTTRELVNMQARIIPSYRGLYEQLVPRTNTLPIGKFAAGSTIANAVLDPLRIMMARGASNPTAMRAAELLGTQSQVGPVAGALTSPFTRSITNTLPVQAIFGQPNQQ